MQHNSRNLSVRLFTLACGFAAPLASQSGVVVDATGNSGPYRTISAALRATSSTDIIRVKKGVYTETIVIDGRAANIVSIAASPADVVLRGATPTSTALTIRNHPAGQNSRFGRMVIDNGQPSLQQADGVAVSQSAGNIVFEEVWSESRWSVTNHSGSLSLTRCVIRPAWPGNYHLQLDRVARAFLHQCTLEPQYTNSYGFSPIVYPGTVVNRSTVELSRCSLRGSHYGSLLIRYTTGGPALTLTDSSCRVSGLATDSIRGGDGHLTSIAHRKTAGGSGIVATRSSIVVSSVQIRAGAGVSVFNFPAPDIANTASTVTRVTNVLPVVQNSAGFTRGRIDTVELFGAPGASSLTWIGLEFSPFQTMFGYLLLNPTGPVVTRSATLNATGPRGAFDRPSGVACHVHRGALRHPVHHARARTTP